MSALNRNPENTNYLQPTKFQLIFPRVTTMTYFLQSFSIPEVSSESVIQTSPFIDLPRPGDKLKFGSLNATFVIDEDMWSYQIIYDWMRGINFPCSFEEYKNLKRDSYSAVFASKPQYSDGFLSVLSGLNNQKVKFHFLNIFPVALSEIDFNTKESSEVVITATVQFNYHIFNILRN